MAGLKRDLCDLEIGGSQLYFEDEIVSISFLDKAGNRSDQLTVELFPHIERPKAGTEVSCIFYTNLGQELDCGLFHVQSTTRHNNKKLTFIATGTEFSKKQKDKISKNYENTTLKGIVNIIAKRMGKKVKFDITNQKVKSIYQTEETDLQFLDRLAEKYDVLFSIKNDIIYFVIKHDDKLPFYRIDASQCSAISVKRSTKKQYKSCEVTFYDRAIAKEVKQKIDQGEPILKVRCSAKSKQEAKLKGKAKLATAQRGTISGHLSTVGQKLYAGTKMELFNTYNGEDDGIYAIEAVTHRYTRDTGWVMDVEFENFKL